MLKNLPAYLAYARKAIVQVLGLVTALLALGLLPDPYAGWLAAVAGVLTTVLHYWVSNAPKPGTEVAVEPVDDPNPDEQPAEWQPADLVTASQVAAKHQDVAPPS